MIFFKQLGETGAEYFFRMIFVEPWKRLRFREIQAGFLEGGTHEFHRVFLSCAWTDADAVENDFALRPVFAEEARLGFAERGQFVVVGLEEGRLRVANEIENAHGQVGTAIKIGPPTVL